MDGTPKNTFVTKTFLVGAVLGVWNMFVLPHVPPAIGNLVTADHLNMVINVLGVAGIGWMRNLATQPSAFLAPLKPTPPVVK